MLLDIVEHVEPMGMHMWSQVHHEFSGWAQMHERPVRDKLSLQNMVGTQGRAARSVGAQADRRAPVARGIKIRSVSS